MSASVNPASNLQFVSENTTPRARRATTSRLTEGGAPTDSASSPPSSACRIERNAADPAVAFATTSATTRQSALPPTV